MIVMDHVNNILTALSIVASVVSIWNAKKAKQYKDTTLLLCDVLKLEGVYTEFTIGSKFFKIKQEVINGIRV